MTGAAQAFDPYPSNPAGIVYRPIWMLVYTNPQREAQVYQKLSVLGFDTFLPTCRNRPGDPQRPLFPRYLFVDVGEPERVSEVTTTEHVSAVLRGAGGEFYVLAEPAIEDLRRQDLEGIVLTKTREIKIGDTIIIPAGPMEGKPGEIKWTKKDLVGGVLHIFGRAAPFSIPRYILEEGSP
jgi:transcription antitermination factor NusG